MNKFVKLVFLFDTTYCKKLPVFHNNAETSENK